MMGILQGFNWGWMDDDNDNAIYHKHHITDEIETRNLYEKFFQVEKGDVVVDIGASVGPFTYSILHKHPKHIFCLEPSVSEFHTLKENVGRLNVTLINKGISNRNDVVESQYLFGGEASMQATTFNTFLSENNIEVIDFMKTDCEGGEYDIFTIDNFCLLKDKLRKVVGEWHLSTPEFKNNFRVFRDVFLRLFPNHEVYSVDGVNIKWDLWNEHFIEYYNEVIIYIDNR